MKVMSEKGMNQNLVTSTIAEVQRWPMSTAFPSLSSRYPFSFSLISCPASVSLHVIIKFPCDLYDDSYDDDSVQYLHRDHST